MLATMVDEQSGLNFDLTEDQVMLQNLARDFARKEIINSGAAEHYDVSGEWPWELCTK